MQVNSFQQICVPPSKTFHLISGGARSGKSQFAVELAIANGSERLFVATAQARDLEMQERIRLHQLERLERFHTVEAPTNVHQMLELEHNYDVIIIDCLSLWISNLMFQGLNDSDIGIQIQLGLKAALNKADCIIIVSNEVGLGIVPDNALARRFRDLNGRLQQELGALATEIHFAALGVILPLKRLARLASQIN